MEVSTGVAQYLEVLLNVAFVVLPTLAVLAAATPTGKYIAKTAISAWEWFRPNVDSTDDFIVQQLSDKLGIPPEEVIAKVTGQLDRVANILREAQPKAG